MSTCTRHGKTHEGKCLDGMDGCFSCGKCCYKMRDCLMLTNKERERNQDPPSGLGPNAPKKH